MTTRTKRPPATLAVDDLTGLHPSQSFAARITFLAGVEHWNTDPELVQALGAALTARDAYRQARSAYGQAASEAGVTSLHLLDEPKYAAHFPTDVIARLRDLRLAANRLDSTLKRSVTALTVRVDRAIASPQAREAAAQRVGQAEALVRQAVAAMDTAEQLLDDTVATLGLSGPLISRASTHLANARMAGDDKPDWLAAYCTAVNSEVATEDQEVPA